MPNIEPIPDAIILSGHFAAFDPLDATDVDDMRTVLEQPGNLATL